MSEDSAALATASDGAPRDHHLFAGPDDHADVAIIVVTYQSAGHLEELIASLRREARCQRLRLIVADNSSSDGTLEIARAHLDVIAMPTGGNLGYAGGVNAAMQAIGDADAILILNPDLVVADGAIAAMRERAAQLGVGIVVPRILNGVGALTTSLRREPSVTRSLGDALFGGQLRRRPGLLAEMVFAPTAYERAHRVDWATGAAMLISREAADAVGAWDARFFLYSEETDICRRARDAGYAVWFDPEAVVSHAEGGSGTSVDLDALLAVNRIRYFAKYHHPFATALFHATVVLNELTRAANPKHRAILRIVVSRRSWSQLPHGTAAASARDEEGYEE